MLLLAACGVPRVGEHPPQSPESAERSKYEQTLDKFTARAEIYSDNHLDTRAFVAATLQADEFVQARVTRQGIFQQMPPQEVASRLEAERARLAPIREFFFGVHTDSPKFEDFDKENSIWRIALVVGDEEIKPAKIERLGRATLDMRSYYPYMDDFWVGYVVQFPRTPASGPMKLKIGSSLGRTDLKFPAGG